MPGRQHEEDDGRELERADQPERPGAAGALVEMPADRDRHDLDAEHGRNAPEREGAQLGRAQGGEGIASIRGRARR
jgi:hypothetical protein